MHLSNRIQRVADRITDAVEAIEDASICGTITSREFGNLRVAIAKYDELLELLRSTKPSVIETVEWRELEELVYSAIDVLEMTDYE